MSRSANRIPTVLTRSAPEFARQSQPAKFRADDLDELTLAFERARPAARQQRKLFLAADERCQGARAAAPSAAARAQDAVERDGDRHALEARCAARGR